MQVNRTLEENLIDLSVKKYNRELTKQQVVNLVKTDKQFSLDVIALEQQLLFNEWKKEHDQNRLQLQQGNRSYRKCI
jgi:hypothetical protein